MGRPAIARLLAPLLCVLVCSPVAALAVDAAAKPGGTLMSQADAAIQALKWSDAIALLKKLVASAPDWHAYQKLGHAQFNVQQFSDAIAAFASAVDLAKAAPDDPATRLAIAQMLTESGNVHLRLRDYDGALASYQAALPFSEKYPIAYFNVCALDYNLGKIETAVADCDAAIRADPDNADAYFIKGSLLFANTTMNADGKMVALPDAVAALNMYLKLAPEGGHVQDVHAMLDSLDPNNPK